MSLLFAFLLIIVSCSGDIEKRSDYTTLEEWEAAQSSSSEASSSSSDIFSSSSEEESSSSLSDESSSSSEESNSSSSSLEGSSSSDISSSSELSSSSEISSSSSEESSSSSDEPSSSSSLYTENECKTHNDTDIDKNSQFFDLRDCKIYSFKTIKGLDWMTENLNYNAVGSLCYENKPKNCDEYGRLYDWQTAQTACPVGWHLSNKGEIYGLFNGCYDLCEENNDLPLLKLEPTGEGSIKEEDNDEITITYSNLGEYGFWWSNTNIIINLGYYVGEGEDGYHYHYNTSHVTLNQDPYTILYSVRYVRDTQ